MEVEMIKVKSDGMQDSAWELKGKMVAPAYPLDIELDEDGTGHTGSLYLFPPLEKGHCHCITPVYEDKEVVGPYINISSAELIKLGEKLIKLGKKYAGGKIHKKETA